MKRLLIYTLILSLLLAGCGGKEQPEELTPEDLIYGPSIEIPEDQEAVTLPPTEENTVTVLRLVRMASLDENGEERWYREYGYDEAGRLITEREVSSAGEESYRVQITYASDGSGREVTTTDSDGRVTLLREQWDGEGRVIRKESLWEDQVEHFTTFSYDDRGNLIEEQTQFSDDPTVLRNEYTYDEQGNRTGHHEYDGDSLTGWQEMEYDEAGHCLLTLSYGFDGALISRTQHDWEGSTEIRSQMDPGGAVYMVTLVTYDEQGNLLRKEIQQEGFVISCSEYTYEGVEITAP